MVARPAVVSMPIRSVAAVAATASQSSPFDVEVPVPFETVILEQQEPGIWLLTINRPQALNALTPAVVEDIASALRTVEAEAGARCLLVTGAGGRAFVAGADIEAMRAMTPLQCRDFSHQGHAMLRAIELAPFPVIALVDGYALGGGCELALACDFIVASEKARFGLPEVGLGICPGMGGTQRLSRVIGKAMAVELVCAGRQITADDGLRLGLVNHVVSPDALLSKGLEIARGVARMGPLAVKLGKALVQRGQDMDLASANAFEVEAFAVLCATADKQEGMAAFVEKRRARFTGR